MERRERLHATWLAECRAVDASQLVNTGTEERSFSDAEVAALWARADQGFAPLNHAYVHVPFCKSICDFCNYERLRPSRPGLLQEWLDALEARLSAIAPGLERHTFHTLYIGGGTPSVLPAALLARLFDVLDRVLRFSWRANRAFELDPAVMDDRRLDVLARRGVRHLSFGVQTLSAEVNAAHDRGPQSRDLVERRLEEFHERGFGVSCDFLLGLAGTEPEGIFEEIEAVVATGRPAWIDVYEVTPTPHYVEGHFGGDLDRFWAHRDRFRGAPERLEAIASDHGWVFVRSRGHRYTLARRTHSGLLDSLRPSYTQHPGEQGAPLNLLGLGPSARSHLGGVATLRYEEGWVGRELDPDDDLRGHLVIQLRDHDRVSRAEVLRLFGRDLHEAFPDAFAAWAAQGRLDKTWRELRLATESRLERLATLLWLLPTERLEWDIARRRGLPWDAASLAEALPAEIDGYRVETRRAAIRLGEHELRLVPALGEAPATFVAGDIPEELRPTLRRLWKAVPR